MLTVRYSHDMTYLLTIVRQGRNSTSEIHAFNSGQRLTSLYGSAYRMASFAFSTTKTKRNFPLEDSL